MALAEESISPLVSSHLSKEDKQGGSPKFDVRDEQGVRWKVKLGDETKAETAATRLVWAAGYYTDEDYYLPELRVDNLPALERGGKFVQRTVSFTGRV